MTFGVGSPGFDPFWCPPCPHGACNTICLDPVDGPLLLIGMLAWFAAIVAAAERRYGDE